MTLGRMEVKENGNWEDLGLLRQEVIVDFCTRCMSVCKSQQNVTEEGKLQWWIRISTSCQVNETWPVHRLIRWEVLLLL